MRRLALLLVLTLTAIAAGSVAGMTAAETPPRVGLSTYLRPAPPWSREPTAAGMTLEGRIGPIGLGVQPGTKDLAFTIRAARLDLGDVPHCRGGFGAAHPPRCVTVMRGALRIAYHYRFIDPGISMKAKEDFSVYLRSAGPRMAHLVGRISLPGPTRIVTFPITARHEREPPALELRAAFPSEPWEGTAIESFHLTIPKALHGRDGTTEPLTLTCPAGGAVESSAEAVTYSDLQPLFGGISNPCA
jgi:hypothetical protein